MASGDFAKTIQVGLRTGVSGANDYARSDETFAQSVFQSHGKYHDAVKRGRVFSGSSISSGITSASLTIGTSAPISLYNPVGSGYNLHILRLTLGYVSGTFGAGYLAWLANTNPAAAATTGTAITKVNNLLGGAASVATMVYTATIPSPTICRPICSLQASLASTAVAPWQIEEDVDSEFIVTPGCTMSVGGVTAAGSSPLIVIGMTWEEFPQ